MAPTEVPTPLDADSTQEPAIYPDPSIGDEDEDDLPSLAEDPASSLPFGSATMRSSRSSSRVVFKTPPIKGARKPIPTKILWSSLSSVGPSTISPLCGGLFKEDSGTITAFVGSDPDSKVNLFSWDSSLDDWVCLGLYQPKGPNNKGPVHQGQFRPTNLKLAAAVERVCTSHSGAKYHGLSALEGETLIPVRTFKAACRRHMILHGMWDVFNLPDPISGGHQDLFDRHGRFSLEHVTQHVASRKKLADRFELDNLKWSGQFLLNSLSPFLMGKVVEEVGIDASGPEVLVGIFAVIFKGDGFDALERVRKQVQDLKIQSFAGQNVEEYVKKVKDGCERLDSANMLQPGDDLLLKIVRNLESTTVLSFQVQMGILYKKVDKWVQSCRVLDPDVAALKYTKFTYESICDECVKEYRELYSGGRWTAQVASKSSAEPQLPAGFLAQMQSAMIASLKQQGLQPPGSSGLSGGSSKSQRSSPQSSDSGCRYCKATDHVISNCPKLKAKKEKEQGNSGSGVSSSAPQYDSWKTVLPSGANPDSCTKKVGKRVWKWCSKCNRFMFHHANGHAAWLERRKQRQTASGSQSISGSQSSGSSPPQPSANLAGDCRLVPTPGSSFWFS